jgi:pyruvate kinase
MKKIKKEIICTLGPSSMKERVIKRLEELGVGLFRINLSHTKLKDLSRVISFIKGITKVPICLDTEGAQIRTGALKDKEVFLQEHSIVNVYRRLLIGDQNGFNLYPEDIIDRLEIGDFVSIGFNSVLAQVIDKKLRYITMRILTSGLIGQNKAVAVERDISMPPLTKKDREALVIGAKMGVRYIALSFANGARDVDEIRSISPKETFIISKIESIKGVNNLEAIAAKSDAIILDRGDLSRQVAIEKIPPIQKDIIRRAKNQKIKIYVATNLLESMVTALTPTRAEVNDIFNTLNDGADGLVLAAETAIGSYPINCATMVSKVIRQFTDMSNMRSPEKLKESYSLLLAEPHGGILVNRFKDYFDENQIHGYKKLRVDKSVLLDAEQIALGTFSPLEGFMNKNEVESVLMTYRLPDGVVWPLPIVLQTTKEKAHRFKKGDTIALALKNKDVYAILHLEDIYTYDLDAMCMKVFGTDHGAHPGVRLLKKKGNYFLGGKIDLIKRLPSAYKRFELTPREARAIFENKGWSRVCSFHTRNVIHRIHEHIQMLAFERNHCDGLFVHPIIGPKKKGDYSADIILKSYEIMIKNHYPKGKVVLGAFQSHSRYSGPREAVFTALCRKNFGCSHFIVGRDHTGVGRYYNSNDAHKLFEHLGGDIGIIPVFFNTMYYCKKCKTYVEKCGHGSKYGLNISGTEARKILKSFKCPPEWYMRKNISKLVLDEAKKGSRVFV